jgi:outer membrane protein assembly factor BamB
LKNLATILFAITILFASSGCEKDPFKPGEDNDEHPVIWQYKYDQHQIHCDVIPAMDENGSIFFSIQSSSEGALDVYVFANDKDGNALWDKHYSSASNIFISRVMYIDNKVIYVVRTYDPLGYYQETIYCLNASNGNEIWQYSPDFKNELLIEAMAVTSDYLIVGAKWGGDYPDIDNLHYFDLTSGTLIKSVNLGDDEVKNISIVGNDIFLGVRTSGVYYTPKLIKMNLESNNILWSFHPEYEDEQAYVFENRSIAIDGNGRAFCVIGKEHQTGSAIIYIMNDDGTLASEIAIPNKMDGIFLNTLIDKDNNFYAATGGYFKYSPAGNQIWEFYTGTSVPNERFFTGCILGDNDFVYHAEYGGILNVNTVGEIAWAKYNETNFTNPGYPLLTDDGNMVVVGDLFVSCIKGDGAKIQDAPWPRVYQNNGNTSSR